MLVTHAKTSNSTTARLDDFFISSFDSKTRRLGRDFEAENLIVIVKRAQQEQENDFRDSLLSLTRAILRNFSS
jgi:hypothetical protein